MSDEMHILDRSRRRWRAIALALALGHVLTLLLVGFLVFWLRAVQVDARNQRMQAAFRLYRAQMRAAAVALEQEGAVLQKRADAKVP
jgi:hypothetical protein